MESVRSQQEQLESGVMQQLEQLNAQIVQFREIASRLEERIHLLENKQKSSLPTQQTEQESVFQGEIDIRTDAPATSWKKYPEQLIFESIDASNKTFTIFPEITHGIKQLELSFLVIGNICIGVKESGEKVPYTKHPYNHPYATKAAYFHKNGRLYYKEIGTEGNQIFQANDENKIVIEVNMNTRQMHLIINNKQQPVFMSKLPDSVQFFIHMTDIREYVRILSVKELSEPTTSSIDGEIEVKWFHLEDYLN
ncbi:MAG: hypothetical protein EZS28_005974 [Streblomastix strix]|uniref:SPRY domain-containing protein n=1 Tax=Streblomastix strix TaxID=222440 RepID=A0A5J4WU63_9EUKA|nr:MAG: hypothetical protein EZS28_005974 [Streblomastix strix]